MVFIYIFYFTIFEERFNLKMSMNPVDMNNPLPMVFSIATTFRDLLLVVGGMIVTEKFKYLANGIGVKHMIWLIIISAIVLVPEHFLHLISVLVHTLYEGIAYAIEELLVLSFGFSKFQAQLIVFYTSFVVGVLGTIGLIRRIPQIVSRTKRLTFIRYIQIRADLIIAWEAFSTRRKLELTLIQFVGIIGIMGFAFA